MARRGHGDGSIYQRSDGRWAASISLEGGSRKTFYGKTRKEIQQLAKVSLPGEQVQQYNYGPLTLPHSFVEQRTPAALLVL